MLNIFSSISWNRFKMLVRSRSPQLPASGPEAWLVGPVGTSPLSFAGTLCALAFLRFFPVEDALPLELIEEARSFFLFGIFSAVILGASLSVSVMEREVGSALAATGAATAGSSAAWRASRAV